MKLALHAAGGVMLALCFLLAEGWLAAQNMEFRSALTALSLAGAAVSLHVRRNQ